MVTYHDTLFVLQKFEGDSMLPVMQQLPLINRDSNTEYKTAQTSAMQGQFINQFQGLFENSSFQDVATQVNALQQKVLAGSGRSVRELLMLQLTIGRFNFHVEMTAKIAESISATAKRLQG